MLSGLYLKVGVRAVVYGHYTKCTLVNTRRLGTSRSTWWTSDPCHSDLANIA